MSAKKEIGHFLGVNEGLISAAIAEQVSSGNIAYASTVATVQLTDRGKNTVRSLESVRPVHVSMSVVFDRLVWSLAKYDRRDLIQKAEAVERGMIVVPPRKTSRISIDEVQAGEVNRILRGTEGKTLRKEVLSVRRIRPFTHRFFPVKLLVFGDFDSGEVELAAVVDGDASVDHDRALTEIGGPDALGISIDEPEGRPVLSDELEAVRVPDEEVSGLRSAAIAGRIEASSREAVAIADPAPTSAEEMSLQNIQVRSVSVFEHREFLMEALNSAARRILLISPWIKSAVVDTDFVQRLEQRLRRGVRVTIAYGIGDNDSQSDAQAIERLRNLSRRYSQLFRFVRLANSHAKVLIFDDLWISTSFNWLSFRGDPERTYRMEEGTLVKIPGQVTAQYERYLEMVDEQEK